MSTFWQRTISAWGTCLLGLCASANEAGSVAHTIAVTFLAGNDGGVGVAGKEVDGRVRAPAIAQGDGIHVADVDEPRLVAHARHGDHKVAAPGEYFDLAYLCGIQYGRIEFGNIRLDQVFDVLFDHALICVGFQAINFHKLLRKPPGKVLINHMKPHNPFAFQTD